MESSEKYGSNFVNLLVYCSFWEKYMLCMFCVKLLMSSSSAIYYLDLLFLIEGKI
jgi:hypothetical protein